MEFFNAAAADIVVVVTFIVAITINVNAADWNIAPLPSMDECSALKTFYRAEKKSLQNIFKQDPGRARQSS